jgi:murein DD-endopeptidase MepM/ murein hydrolase activator NlpD
MVSRVPRHAVMFLFLLSSVATGCGQYAGVHDHRGPPARPIRLAGGVASPSPSPRAIRPPDGVEGPQNADVVGGSRAKRLPEWSGEQEPGGGGGDGKGRPGSGGPEGRGPGSGTPSPAPTDPISLAELISRATVKGFRYNSRVLPPGFPFWGCPVQGRYAYSDGYGAPRYGGGFHPHAGNDIFAAIGTPVVAPFDGYVKRVPNRLGGLAVKVYGDQGYVYMAHLVAYGITQRHVEKGTVVGFVGRTGNARGTSPHNHFEWHPKVVASYDRVIPGTRGAVDPFPYLQVVCPPA